MVKLGSYPRGLVLTVLLLQTLLTPALGLVKLSQEASATVICTAEGLRTVAMHEPDGHSSDPGWTEPCIAPGALPGLLPVPVPDLPAPRWAGSVAAWRVVPAERQAQRTRAAPFDSTGPPGAIA